MFQCINLQVLRWRIKFSSKEKNVFHSCLVAWATTTHLFEVWRAKKAARLTWVLYVKEAIPEAVIFVHRKMQTWCNKHPHYNWPTDSHDDLSLFEKKQVIDLHNGSDIPFKRGQWASEKRRSFLLVWHIISYAWNSKYFIIWNKRWTRWWKEKNAFEKNNSHSQKIEHAKKNASTYDNTQYLMLTYAQVYSWTQNECSSSHSKDAAQLEHAKNWAYITFCVVLQPKLRKNVGNSWKLP